MNRKPMPEHSVACAVLILPLLLLVPSSPAGAAVVLVPGQQPTIQAGIDAATDGDTVLVADGTWTGEGNRDLDFGGRAITVRSRNGPDNCIIDGEQLGRGFHLHGGEGRNAAIRGFTITNCGIYNDTLHRWESGAGILCDGASPVIEGNLILENLGNGISCANGSEALIVNNTISGNQPNNGAGIYCSHASPTISDNRISGNTASPFGPSGGGGIFCHDSQAVINGNLITGNTAKEYVEFLAYGGGIRCHRFNGRIDDNVIEYNESETIGGGICLYESAPMMWNNLIRGNSARKWGGGMSAEYRSEPLMAWNTITGNTVTVEGGQGGGLHINAYFTGPAAGDGTIYTIRAWNTIIAGNTADQGSQAFVTNRGSTDVARLALRYCDVEGGEDGIPLEQGAMLAWGDGMIAADPLFATGPDGTHYLSQVAAGQPADSPCVDTGDPAARPIWGTTRTDVVQDATPGDMGYHHAMPQRLVSGPGPGHGNPPDVRLFFPRQDAAPLVSFTAYGPSHCGVNVTCGDVTGDGLDEIITGAGPGWFHGAHVRGFDGRGAQLPGLSFLAYPIRHWGVNVACGNVDGFGSDEIITGPGPGPDFSAHVRIWLYSSVSGTVTSWGWGSFIAYGTQRWGVNVACGDLDGDGFDEIVTGAGPGLVFQSHVRGWNVDSGPTVPMPGVSFFAYGTTRFGVNVSCGDIDGDGIDEIVTAPGASPFFTSHIRAFNADGGSVSPVPHASFFAWPPDDARYGATVYAGADLDGDGRDDLLVGGGPDPDSGGPVKAFNFASGFPTLWFSTEVYPGLTRGANVAGGRFQP